MNELDPTTISTLRTEIIRCIKELLEKKHLYQSVRIDTTIVEKLIDGVEKSEETGNFAKQIAAAARATVLTASYSPPQRSPRDYVQEFIIERQKNIKKTADFILENFWSFSTDVCNQLLTASGTKPKDEITHFELPMISVHCECKECDDILPHNSGFRGQTQEFQTVSLNIRKGEKQVLFQTFVFPYQCQKCKEDPLVFLVHREGIKLTLAGRNHFEDVKTPKTIPEQERKYFRDAIVASNTGNVLAGLFLLRTTIEQYMRRILEVTDRKTGDELADKYAKLLNDEFPKSYPSMKVIYEELSIKLHSADGDSTQFEKSKKDIENHFELLKFHPLKKEGEEGVKPKPPRDLKKGAR